MYTRLKWLYYQKSTYAYNDLAGVCSLKWMLVGSTLICIWVQKYAENICYKNLVKIEISVYLSLVIEICAEPSYSRFSLVRIQFPNEESNSKYFELWS